MVDNLVAMFISLPAEVQGAIIGGIIGGFLGTTLGAFLNHWLAKRRIIWKERRDVRPRVSSKGVSYDEILSREEAQQRFEEELSRRRQLRNQQKRRRF